MAPLARLAGGAMLALALIGAPPAETGTRLDVQLIGLPPLYEALVAVANCPNVALDDAEFARVARLYHLRPEDLTLGGPFSIVIADLDVALRIRVDDDRDAFCSINRLVFAVPHGVLVDRGPVVPHPLPRAVVPRYGPY